MATTQLDVAARAGVSRALVSLVMRGSDKVAPETRWRVLRAAEELGYRPNAFAARLASRSSRVLGTVLVQLDNPLFPETMRRIEESASASHFGMLLKAGPELDLAGERAAINDHLSFQVDGLVLVSTRLPDEELQELAMRLPVVTIYRTVPDVDGVVTDEGAASSLVVEHLLRLGHRRIALVDAGSNPGATARRHAYETMMRANGLADEIRIAQGDYTEPGGRRAAATLLQGRRPSAIFAANDLSAIGVMGAAREAGLSIPGDLAVAGIDNVAMSGYPLISLTTAEQPVAVLSQEAIRLVTERIADGTIESRHVVCQPHLMVRSSTAFPSESRTTAG